MRKIKVGDEELPVKFTTWTVDQFFKMTGINLYDPAGITKVFVKFDDGQHITPTDFEIIVKFAYCALAAAVMPDDAEDDWKPAFSWRGIMNKFDIKDGQIYLQLLSAYYDKDAEAIVKEFEKNYPALQPEGQ